MIYRINLSKFFLSFLFVVLLVFFWTNNLFAMNELRGLKRKTMCVDNNLVVYEITEEKENFFQENEKNLNQDKSVKKRTTFSSKKRKENLESLERRIFKSKQGRSVLDSLNENDSIDPFSKNSLNSDEESQIFQVSQDDVTTLDFLPIPEKNKDFKKSLEDAKFIQSQLFVDAFQKWIDLNVEGKNSSIKNVFLDLFKYIDEIFFFLKEEKYKNENYSYITKYKIIKEAYETKNKLNEQGYFAFSIFQISYDLFTKMKKENIIAGDELVIDLVCLKFIESSLLEDASHYWFSLNSKNKKISIKKLILNLIKGHQGSRNQIDQITDDVNTILASSLVSDEHILIVDDSPIENIEKTYHEEMIEDVFGKKLEFKSNVQKRSNQNFDADINIYKSIQARAHQAYKAGLLDKKQFINVKKFCKIFENLHKNKDRLSKNFVVRGNYLMTDDRNIKFEIKDYKNLSILDRANYFHANLTEIFNKIIVVNDSDKEIDFYKYAFSSYSATSMDQKIELFFDLYFKFLNAYSQKNKI